MTSGSGNATRGSVPKPEVWDLSVSLAPELEVGGSLPSYLGSSKWTEGDC
jgi:hypothetical protein